jgi:hypothetical protein
MRPLPLGQPSAPPPKKKRGCLFVLALLTGGSLMCCCLSGALLVAAGESDPGGASWDPVQAVVSATGENDLGDARAPAELAPGGERSYRWRKGVEAYRLGYGLSGELHEEVDQHLEELAERFSYREGNPFTWMPPQRCQPQPWRCIFDEVAGAGAGAVAPLTELFRRRQTQSNLDPRTTTALVVSFVQNITYRLPTERRFGILPPAVVVSDGSGDCDSKALLAAIILEDLGIDAVMLYSQPLAHAALGVALPSTGGTTFASGGRKYLFVEVTNPGWGIGIVPPEYDKPRQWEVIPFGL